MLPCADFAAVNRFLQISLVVQSSASTDDEEVGPKNNKGKHGERGFLVVATNPNAVTSTPSKINTSFDELYHRSQEDDDSAAEDVLEYRQHSFPESKHAPFYARLRIGLDTRDERPQASSSGLSSDDPHNNSSTTSSSNNIARPTNPHKMVSVAGLDSIIPFHLLPRDEEGNLPFTIQTKHNAALNGRRSNEGMKDYVNRVLTTTTAVVVDDRDHSGAFWNVLGELLMASVAECAEGKGVVKVFAMATPAVTMVGGHSMSKLYDLSKIPPEDDEEAAAAEEAANRRGGQHLPQEPSLQYNPSSEEYNLAGVSGVDLLVPPELDPEEPPEDETIAETIERKRESVVSLLYLWIKSHHQALVAEGAVHTVFIIQRIPNSDKPTEARLSVVTGIFDESRSHVVKEDERKNKPAGGQFSVWSKQLKEGEHHSQRLVGGASSVATLVREIMKILSKGPAAKKELQTSTMREMIRAHVLTRLLKASISGPDAKVAWLSCIRRGRELQAGRFEDPYSNESDEVRSFIVPPPSYMTHLRVMETLTTLNKYRLRRAPPTLARGTGATGSSSGGFSSNPSNRSSVDYQARQVAPRRVNNVGDLRSMQIKRIVFMKRKLEDQELQLRAKMLQMERAQRVKVEREKTAYRLKEYARQRKEAMIAKKKEIKEQMAQVREDRIRRNAMKRKRQFTPVGKRSTNWNPSPPAPVVGRRRPATPPPVPKRIIRRPPPPPPKPTLETSQEGSSPQRPWAEPKLGGGGPPNQRGKPLPPARPVGKAPSQANPRGGRGGLIPPAEIKKIETNEFMQRTMIEQEWTRGVKKFINEAFDDDDDTTERLLMIQKGNVPPARATSTANTSSVVSPTSRAPSAVSPTNVPPVRKRSAGKDRPTSPAQAKSTTSFTRGGAAARRDSQESNVSTILKKPVSPPPKQAALKQPPKTSVQQRGREASITPNSSGASSRRSNRSRSVSPVDTVGVKKINNTTAAPPPKQSTAAPAPRTRSESPVSSRRSSPLSSRKSSRSSSRSMTSGHVVEEVVESVSNHTQQRRHSTTDHGGPMVPIPVESSYIAPSKAPEQDEEYYRGRTTARVADASQGGIGSTAVRAVNSTTTITRTVRTTSNIEQLSSPTRHHHRNDEDDDGAEGFEEEDVAEVRSITSTTKERRLSTQQQLSVPPAVQPPQAQPQPQQAARRQSESVRSSTPLSDSRSASAASSRSRSRSRSPTPPHQAPFVAQPVDTKISASSSTTNGVSATESTQPRNGGRQRFRSSDFSGADYGEEAPTAVVKKNDDSEFLGAGGAGLGQQRRASEAPSQVGDGSRRRSSIGHLMDAGSDHDSDFDLMDL